jgi:hypothetical protein
MLISWCSQMDPSDDKKTNRFRNPLLIFFSILGFILADVETDRIMNGALVPWEDVSLPDGQLAQSFEYGENFELFVRADNGEVFVRWQNRDTGGWTKEQDEQGNLLLCNTTSHENISIRRPPGKVVQTADCQTFYLTYGETSERYVILSSGEIWHWMFSSSVAGGFGGLVTFILFAFFFTLWGYSVGLIATRTLKWSLQEVRVRFRDEPRPLGLRVSQLAVASGVGVILLNFLLFYVGIKLIIQLMVFANTN